MLPVSPGLLSPSADGQPICTGVGACCLHVLLSSLGLQDWFQAVHQNVQAVLSRICDS